MIHAEGGIHLKSKTDKYEYLLANLTDFFAPVNRNELSLEIYMASGLSALCNFTALLKDMFESFSWVGFYVMHDNTLFLGPFQGKVACDRIPLGQGVCGTAAERMETLVVSDVHSFEGHIACDTSSNSEVVVPVIIDGRVWGVLDIDSHIPHNFDETDGVYLGKIVNLLFQIIK